MDPSALPARERAESYRALAAHQVDLSRATSDDEARAAHLELAALWLRLAAQAEHQILEDRRAAGGLEGEAGSSPSV